MRTPNIFLIVFLLVFSCSSKIAAVNNKPDKPKNIILFIGDGMGINHIKACDYYYDLIQPYEKWEDFYWVSTFPYGSSYNTDSAWTFFNYVKERWTDSAPAATAMASGVKTNNNVIGLDHKYLQVETVCETAKKFNKSVGIITTVPIPHATPAAFLAHVVHRNYYHTITAQMLINSKADVIIGCGNPEWDNSGKPAEKKSYTYFYPSIWNDLKKGKLALTDETGIIKNPNSCDNDNIPDKWFLCENLSTFDSIAKGLLTPKRLLGIPQVYETLQYERKKNENETNPYDTPLNSNVPNLQQMTIAGLNVLKNNSKGFFLMVEGGAIDWAGHDGNAARLIEEMNDFNNSVSAVIDWVEKNSSWSETLIIVVSDHETAYLTGQNINEENFKELRLQLENNGKNKLPGMFFHNNKSKGYYEHTNSLIPIYIKGAGSEIFKKYLDETDLVRGKYMQNNEIGLALFELITTDNNK